MANLDPEKGSQCHLHLNFSFTHPAFESETIFTRKTMAALVLLLHHLLCN